MYKVIAERVNNLLETNYKRGIEETIYPHSDRLSISREMFDDIIDALYWVLEVAEKEEEEEMCDSLAFSFQASSGEYISLYKDGTFFISGSIHKEEK